MTGWRIRKAGPQDAAAVLKADVFDGPPLVEAVRAFLGPAGAPDPRNILLLAETGGTVVGFVSATVLDHPDKPRALFIQELGVKEEARGRGLGRALISAIREAGRRKGCTVSWVLTEAGNAPARATYAAAGGQETTGVVMVEWDEDQDDPGVSQEPPLRPPAPGG